MFCIKCGTELPADAKFCFSCGEAAATVQAVDVKAEENKTPEMPLRNETPAKPAKRNKKLISITAAAAVVIVAVITAFTLFGGSAESVLKKYLDGFFAFDFNGITKYNAYNIDNFVKEVYKSDGLTEKEFNDILFEEYGARNWKEYVNYMGKTTSEELRYEYGGNYKITYKILESRELNGNEISSSMADIEDMFNWMDLSPQAIASIINIDKIEGITEFDIEFTVTDRNGSYSEADTFICVQISGKWYVMDNILPGTLFDELYWLL